VPLTNDEAKELYVQAVRHVQARRFPEALPLLDQLDAERPNSRHVLLQRAHCLVGLERLDEAEALCARMEGKVEPAQLEDVRAAVANARMLSQSALRRPATDAPAAPPARPAPAPAEDGRNVMTVESVFAVSLEEATVTGHLDSGVFRVGDVLSVVSPEGEVVQAPIRRIGPAETPVNLVRAGQRVVLLLAVDPSCVAPGAALTSATKQEAYAATMMVDAAQPATDPGTLPQPLVEAERHIRAHAFDDALAALRNYLATDPDHPAAHRLLARVYLDAGTHIRNADLALEHIRRAYELGGAQDPAVVEVLAEALAETGDAAQGLRFLERLFQATQDPQARFALTTRIRDFRGRHKLGHVWEFSDNYGDVVFESADLAEVAKALANGTVPREGKCRRDRVGEWVAIQEALAGQHPDIAAVYAPAKGANSWLFPLLVAILVAAIVAAIVLM
jgi:thioredoxin-like negative regulator of GroEL